MITVISGYNRRTRAAKAAQSTCEEMGGKVSSKWWRKILCGLSFSINGRVKVGKSDRP
jgi:hypothetical protein